MPRLREEVFCFWLRQGKNDRSIVFGMGLRRRPRGRQHSFEAVRVLFKYLQKHRLPMDGQPGKSVEDLTADAVEAAVKAAIKSGLLSGADAIDAAVKVAGKPRLKIQNLTRNLYRARAALIAGKSLPLSC